MLLSLTLGLIAALLAHFLWSPSPSTSIQTRSRWISTHPNELISPNLINRIDAIRSKWRIPGLTLSIVASPKYTGGGWNTQSVTLGVGNAAGDLVTEDSMYTIGSNSKLFTVIAIGMLIENHTILPNGEVLDWSTKVKDILPEWKLLDEYASDHVDLVDLMSMRSGLPRHDWAIDSGATPQDILSSIPHLRPSSEIRQSTQYNNQHYFILSHIIPTLTNIPFVIYVTQHILDPLGMNQTTMNATTAYQSGRRTDGFVRSGMNFTDCALGWNWDRNGTERERLKESCLGEVRSIGWWTSGDGIGMAGVGGVTMSGRDMGIWLRELLSPTIIPPRILQKVGKTLTTLLPPHYTQYPEIGIMTYGLAQWSYPYRGYLITGHIGEMTGQSSVLSRLDDEGIGLMMVVNDQGFGGMMHDTVQYMVLDEMLGLDVVGWEERIFGDGVRKISKTVGRKEGEGDRLSESAVEGVIGRYYAEGYGGIEISLLDPTPPDQLPLKNHPHSQNFTGQVQHNHHQLISRHLFTTSQPQFPMYIAEVSKFVATHLLFTPYDGTVFNWTALSILPTFNASGPDGEMTVLIDGMGSCVITPLGIGMFGDYWGLGNADYGKEPVLEGAEEEAEVWYSRIG